MTETDLDGVPAARWHHRLCNDEPGAAHLRLLLSSHVMPDVLARLRMHMPVPT